VRCKVPIPDNDGVVDHRRHAIAAAEGSLGSPTCWGLIHRLLLGARAKVLGTEKSSAHSNTGFRSPTARGKGAPEEGIAPPKHGLQWRWLGCYEGLWFEAFQWISYTTKTSMCVDGYWHLHDAACAFALHPSLVSKQLAHAGILR
jgi:hypothetical protein